MAENQAPSPVPSTAPSNTDSTASNVTDQAIDSIDEHASGILQDAGAATNTTPTKGKSQTAKEVKEEKKRIKALKLKVDGKEFEEVLPFEIDDNPEAVEYLKRELQLARMGQKRSQEASRLQKDVASFFEALKQDPMAVLSDPNIGIDIKKEIAKYIEKEVENSKKSPEQVEKERLEAELKKVKEEREREKLEMQQKEFERLQEKAYEEYDRQISDALDKSSLPKNPYIIKKVADYMLLGLQQGIDVNADDVLPLVQDEMRKELRDMFGVMPEETIEKFIGKETLTKLRKKNVSKVRPPSNTKPLDVGKQSAQEKKQDQVSKKTSYKDFFRP